MPDQSPATPVLWRIALVVVISIVFAPMGLLFAVLLARKLFVFDLSESALLAGQSPVSVLILLASICIGLPALALCMRWLHKSNLAALFRTDPLRKAWFFWAMGVVATVSLVQLLVSALPVFIPNVALSQWLLWFAPALGLIFLQSATEEVVFRGYAQQMLLARFKSVWLALLIPSLAFGLGHYNPATFGANAWLAVAVTCVWGLMMAHLTWQSGSLLPAIGVHFANNIVAIIVVAQPEGLPGLALFVWPEDPSGAEIRRALITSSALEIGVYTLYQAAIRTRRKPRPS